MHKHWILYSTLKKNKTRKKQGIYEDSVKRSLIDKNVNWQTFSWYKLLMFMILGLLGFLGCCFHRVCFLFTEMQHLHKMLPKGNWRACSMGNGGYYQASWAKLDPGNYMVEGES